MFEWKYDPLRRCVPFFLKLHLGWVPSIVNSFQWPFCTQTIHFPLVREFSVKRRAWGCVEREKRMTPKHWLYLLCVHWGCRVGMGGFSEEVRGLLFSLIVHSDIEGMTKDQWDRVNFNYSSLQFSQRCTIVPLRGNQWGDKLLWTATPFICCVGLCMPECYF